MARRGLTEGRAWLTVNEAAAYTGQSPESIRSAAHGGRLPAYRGHAHDGKGLTNVLRMYVGDLDAWMRESPVAEKASVAFVLLVMVVGCMVDGWLGVA